MNNHDQDVVASTGLSGTSSEITMRPGDTFVVSDQPNNNNPISVTAIDKATSGEVKINGQTSVSVTPDEIFGASFQVLSIGSEKPGKCVVRTFKRMIFKRILICSETILKYRCRVGNTQVIFILGTDA